MSGSQAARAHLMDAWHSVGIEARRAYLSKRRLPCAGTPEELDAAFRAHVDRMMDGLPE